MSAALATACACGCGQPTRRDPRTGQPRRYVLGHNPTPGRRPLPVQPDPDAPADAPRCTDCPYPLVPATRPGPPPKGWLKHKGRGLCSQCHNRASYAGQLDDHDRRTRTRDDVLAEWDWLRRDGVGRTQAAARIGITLAALERHIYRARRAGDPRAVLGSK